MAPSEQTTRQTEQEFRRLVDAGMEIRPAGTARNDPSRLLSRGYTPKYKVELFDTRYYLTNVRQNDYIRFFVAYVVQEGARGRTAAFPRIFYKDVSLIWRCASHITRLGGDTWIGKGDVTTIIQDGEETVCSMESTTDLPLEIQSALEDLIRRPPSIPTDERAPDLILRRAPDGRIEPFRDFSEPRRRARANRRNRIHGGRSIARFTRRNDPTSLRVAAGFEPDFRKGILDMYGSTSRLYGGTLQRFRILSKNRKVQYLFFAGPRHVWIIPPQATTTELSTYGVRTVDVEAAEDLCIPGYEYHFMDESQDPPVPYSQIPAGFAGPPSDVDDSRADASSWLDRIPIIQQFRRQVLKAPLRRSATRGGSPAR